MKRINLSLVLLIAVGFAALLSFSISTTALARISDGTSIARYSGPRASIAVSVIMSILHGGITRQETMKCSLPEVMTVVRHLTRKLT